MQTKRNYTIEQILNYDVEELHTMTEDELLDLVRGSVNKVRRRARSLEAHNLERAIENEDGTRSSVSIPYETLMESGGYSFDKSKYRRNQDGSIKRNDLIADVLRYQNFLGSQTSSYKGLMEWDEHVAQSFKSEEARDEYRRASWQEKRDYWKLVDEIKDKASETVTFWDSGRLHTLIIEEISADDYNDLPFGERVDKLKAKLEGKKKVEIQRKFSGR